MLHETKTIIFAVEPFAEPQAHIDRYRKILDWFKGQEVRILIVSILNSDDLGWPGEVGADNWSEQVVQRTRKNLSERFSAMATDQRLEFNVLIQPKSGKAKTVDCFLNFATQEDTDLLVVHSHTKSSFLSAIGSFCDKLIRVSNIPVLILPFDKVDLPLPRTILFPTDFSRLSAKVFQALTKWNRIAEAQIALYHRLPTPIDEIMQIALHPAEGRTVMPSDFILLNHEERNVEMQKWLAWAKNHHQRVTATVNSNNAILSDAILAEADQQGADLIALPTHTSQADVPTIGSTVMHVLRLASIPTLVIPIGYLPSGSFAND
jgi:nucleotide-binding universal stress UspA family protein